MAAESESDGAGPTAAQIAGGLLDGQAEAVKSAGEAMLHGVRPGARFLLKRIPGAPALVFDLAQFAQAPNKTRALFGLTGGAIGGAAGGALGAAAGGVNAPIGAALGSTFGEGVGERIYDDHAAAIDRRVADIDHGLADTETWMRKRWNQVAGRPQD